MVTLRSEASIGTEAPDRYLAQLCKNFGSPIQTSYTSNGGRAEFGFGQCTMTAADRYLLLVVEAEDEQSLAKMQHLVGLRLERCMWREKPTINWVRSA